MNYPNDFDTPAFPAGKSVAFSRAVSIWISVVFFLIFCACGFILLTRHLQKNYPFLISVDPFTNEWSAIAYPNKNSNETIEQYQIFQEKLVSDFVTSWFTISDNREKNEERWEECSMAECSEPYQYAPGNEKCAIYCSSGTSLYEQFSDVVLPEYAARFSMGPEYWHVGKMDIKRIDQKDKDGKYSDVSGQWQVYANIYSNINGLFKILAFVEIDRDLNSYPATMGYYVKDFNSYRMTQ